MREHDFIERNANDVMTGEERCVCLVNMCHTMYGHAPVKGFEKFIEIVGGASLQCMYAWARSRWKDELTKTHEKIKEWDRDGAVSFIDITLYTPEKGEKYNDIGNWQNEKVILMTYEQYL